MPHSTQYRSFRRRVFRNTNLKHSVSNNSRSWFPTATAIATLIQEDGQKIDRSVPTEAS